MESHDLNQEYTMKIGQEPTIIAKVDSEKDLGVTVDKSLKFTEHIDNKIKLANRNLGLIFRTFAFLATEIFLNLYKSLVRQQLEYAASVWSPVYKKDKITIENMRRRATKLVKKYIAYVV